MLKFEQNQLMSDFQWFDIELENEQSKKMFTAERIVFHSPSEHQIDGEEYDLEMQFQLTNDITPSQKKILVIFGKIEPNHRNSLLEPFASASLNLIDNQSILEIDFKESFQHELLKLQSPLEYISYTGSLTTPPCNPPTTWIILTQPMSLSSETIKQLIQDNNSKSKQNSENRDRNNYIGGNNREIQEQLKEIEYVKGEIVGMEEEEIEKSEEVQKQEEKEGRMEEEENSMEEEAKTGDNILDIQIELEKKNEEVMQLVKKLKKIRQNELGVEEEN